METLNDYLPTTPDLNAERLADLRRLWPDLFTNEGQPNPTAVQAALGLTTPAAERYAFTWSGKTAARQNAFAPTTTTLVPDAARSFQPEKGRHAIIEGDNLQVLKLLLSGYRERVKCIYIDPPYNTGKDFVYSDNYTEDKLPYWEQTGGIQDGVRTDTNPDSHGRYHSDWLSMMYSRLLLARQLLREDGVIFVSIDDNEAYNLQKVLDEVFGDENFVGKIIWKNVTDNNPTLINSEHEYVLVFAKDRNALPDSWKSQVSDAKSLMLSRYDELKAKDMSPESIQDAIQEFIKDNRETLGFLTRYKFVDEDGVYTGSESVHNPRAGGYKFEVLHPDTRKPMRAPANGYRFPEATFRELEAQGIILYGDDENRIVKLKKQLRDFEDTLRSVIVLDGRLGSYDFKRVFETDKTLFNNPKPVELIKSFLSYSTERADIILDFYGGSGTTFQAVAELNAADNGTRQCILVQLPEQITEGTAAYDADYHKISDLTIERAKRVVTGYGANPQPLETGFQVWRLEPSRFPAARFQPKPGQSADEQLAELKKYLAKKQATLQLPFMDDDQPARVAEILLKNGFSLNYTLSEPLPEYLDNRIVRVTDQETNKTALLALDDALTDATVQQLSHQPPAEKFIAPERAFNTTAKWNLKMHLKDNLLAT